MVFSIPLSILFSLGNIIFKYSPDKVEAEQLNLKELALRDQRRNKLLERILNSYTSSPVSLSNLAILANTYRMIIMRQESPIYPNHGV